MRKNKQGIFDSSLRKIVGELNIENEEIYIVINGTSFLLKEIISQYNNFDITISVGNVVSECD